MSATLRLGFELARRGYRRYAAYPGATWAGLFTNSFFGLLIAYVMVAVYENREDIGGYDAAEALTYVWLGQGLLAVVASFGPSWHELAMRVRSGDVAVDLHRPLDLQAAGLAQDFGRATHQLLFRAFPPFLVRAFAEYEALQASRGRRQSGPLVTPAMLDRLEVIELHRVQVEIP